ncbi:MAG: inositol monophosphatase family protein [Hyphomicrobiaceae bacterium]|nr:inositol monophosphatase family protein [Hyphomicrobiaceae bacterium]
MTTVDIEKVVRIVRDVAAAEILPRWRNLAEGDVTTKEGAGLVTVADHAAEAALTELLAGLLPGSVVVGEEAVAADPGVLQRLGDREPVWVIDPIDGTRKFADGEPTFDVMVALVVGGRPVAGWIYAPAEDVLYVGEQGAGSRVRSPGGDRTISAPAGLPLSEMEGIVSPGAFTSRGQPDPAAVRDRFRNYVRHQCAGHNYGRLFLDESQFLINFSTFAWDHLPGLAIASAAGFHAARHDAAPFDPLDAKGGVLVAPDRASWQGIRALLLDREPAAGLPRRQ